MNEFVEYVAGADEIEARLRYEAGLGRELREHAEQDAENRTRGDHCEPKCVYSVYRVRTTLEQM